MHGLGECAARASGLEGRQRWRGSGDSSVFAEDVVIYPTSEWPDDQVYRGHDGFRRLYHAWVDYFEDWTWELQEIRDADDQVVSLVEMRGRLKDSGTAGFEAWGVVYSDFRDGRVGNARWFRSQRQALEAVGLADDA